MSPSKDELEQAFEAMANWHEGRIVLRRIFELTGYSQDVKRVNAQTGEVNVYATMYNLSKRDVWLKVQEYLSPESRAMIEHQEDKRNGRTNADGGSTVSARADTGV